MLHLGYLEYKAGWGGTGLEDDRTIQESRREVRRGSLAYGREMAVRV